MAARLPKVGSGMLGRRRVVVSAAVALALLVGLLGWGLLAGELTGGSGFAVENREIAVAERPGSERTIPIDTRLYTPDNATADQPAASVLLAHGFGGTKRSVGDDAKDLARRGYVVLTWTARGFGTSGGRIHLNDPDREVADASRLLDWLAERPEVLQDADGDPRVGVTGASYGGALALSVAGLDARVDAIAPHMTWNDLGTALFPSATGQGVENGVLKQAWAGQLFGSGIAPVDPSCGRFAPEICRLYQRAATTGRADAENVRTLRHVSPDRLLGGIRAPTLLVQGTADTLFPLSEADANARGITNGTPVRVAWFSGGHDDPGSTADQDRVRDLTATWFDHYLRDIGPDPGTSFEFSRITGWDYETETVRTVVSDARRYPGLDGSSVRSVRLEGSPQPIANPPGGTPAAVSSLPGLSGLAAVRSSPNGEMLDDEIPGQFVSYLSDPLDSAVDVVGSPRVRLRVTSATGDAVLFVKLYDIGPDSSVELLGGQVAPIRLTGLPTSQGPGRTTGAVTAAAGTERAAPVTVELPGLVHRFEAGHRLKVNVATADQAYAGPEAARTYTVGLAGNEIGLPDVAAEPAPDPAGVWLWRLGGVAGAILLGILAAWWFARRRSARRDRTVVEDYAEVPLVVRGLRKEYPTLTAVKSVDFEVHRGQVVGLLGPNGAGKTTTLRVLLGLIMPTAGDAWIFGHRVHPGAPVLTRLGALVEGPGLLPHLSGRANLEEFWQATGRPRAEARLDDVLEIADLGTAIDRKVKTYSHGMKQRLAIAQAMLGLPELLVLDEPTDGLDPPQIAEMRRVLRRYADDGRAVLVSSHLLAEVEQTCSHVVVVHQGVRVAAGPVAEVAGDSQTVVISVDDSGDSRDSSTMAQAERLSAELDGVRSVARQNGSLVVDLDGLSRSALVRTLVAGGVEVGSVVPRRRLEDAFLTLVGEPVRGEPVTGDSGGPEAETRGTPDGHSGGTPDERSR